MKKQVAYLQKLFHEIWNDFGSVFLLVRHSNRTRIGNRGFTDDEKRQGLILVFNSRTNAKLDWDADGSLSCVLAFGARKEDVFIHFDDLVGVFSSEAGVQFLRSDMTEPEAAPGEPGERRDAKQVVSISSFRKKKPGAPGSGTSSVRNIL